MSPQQRQSTSGAPAPWSRTAIAAMACSAVLCFPPASILGIGLAIVALLRIARSPIALRGRGLAIGAIALGGLGLLGTTMVIQWHDQVYRRRLDDAMILELETILEAAQRGEVAIALDRWAADVPLPTESDLRSFGESITVRLGDVRSVSIVRQQTGGTMLSPTMELAVTVTFERRTLIGSAAFALVPVPGSVHPEVRVRSVHLEDAQGGALRLPPEATPTSASQ